VGVDEDQQGEKGREEVAGGEGGGVEREKGFEGYVCVCQ
jgi:hypothetical protein